MKKILILSITAGQGHNQCGMSLCKYFEEQGHCARMFDALEYISPLMAEGVSKGYLLTTKYSPGAYGGVYRLMEKKTKQHQHYQVIMAAFIKRLAAYIDEFAPDVIICTHIFCAQFISTMKDLTAKTVGVITDFTVHPFWEDSDLDYYVVPSEYLELQLVRKGIDPKKMLPFGIPIHEKFSESRPKAEARQLLGLADKPTVLVMSGSMGYGNICKQIRRLNRIDFDFQLVTVCGSNKRLKERIDKLKLKHPVYNHGYVDNVDLMMDAADIIVTKPGGLTTSEALAKRLPIIMADPIPGQEERNVEFLLNQGVAMKISSTYPLDECVYTLLKSEERRECMRRSMEQVGKQHATRRLAEFVVEL